MQSEFGVLAPGLPVDAQPQRPLSEIPGEVVARSRALGASESPRGRYLLAPEVAAGRAARLSRALPPWADVRFAVKACGHRPVLAALADVLDGFEVASTAERDAVRGVAPRAAVLAAGPAKGDDLLAALAADPRTEAVNVESPLELHRLAAAARTAGRRVPVAIRVNPAPRSGGPSGAIAMGGASPFGVAEGDVPALLEQAAGLPELDVVGFHVHAASGGLDADAHADHVAWCLRFAGETAAAHGLDLRLVDAGGGLGVDHRGTAELDAERLGARLAALGHPAGCRLVLEPGRWIAGPAGWYAAPVRDVKVVHGRAFAVLAGGIGHFLLPATWDLPHGVAVVPVGDWPADLPRPEVDDRVVTVAGELCTPEDTLVPALGVARLRAGDVLVFTCAGAYGWELAVPAFLGHAPAQRDAVVLAPADRDRLVGPTTARAGLAAAAAPHPTQEQPCSIT